MPLKRSYRRKRSFRRRYVRKRPYRRGLKTRHYTSSFRRTARSFVPSRLATKLVYNNTFDVNSGVNVNWSEHMSLNGMNDPWITGAGHQPRGFDQFSALYNNYYVTGVKVVLEGNVNTSGAYLLSVGAWNNGITPPTDAESLNELTQYSTLVLSNQRPYKFVKYYDVAKVLGLTRRTIPNDENYFGLSTGTTNPNYGGFIDIQMRNLDTAGTNEHQMTCTLIYYCTYFNRQLVNPS